MIETDFNLKLETFLENYVETLYANSNMTECNEQKNLYPKKKYYLLLKPVFELLKQNNITTLNELREKLYKNSKLESILKKFIYEKKLSPGLVLAFGTLNYQEMIVIGNKQEVDLNEKLEFIKSIRNMTSDTIFDLASLTKVFTSVSVYQLASQGLINLNDEVTKYLPNFKNLEDITIYDLLTFTYKVETEKRIDETNSYDEAFLLLETSSVKDLNPKRRYVDINAMILAYLVEAVTKKEFYEYVNDAILKPLQMEDTHAVVPNYKLDRVASTNGSVKCYKDKIFTVSKEILPGVVYDKKARILGQNEERLTGHAGLFSTASDMGKFARGLINNQILDEENLETLAKNKTGRRYFKNGKANYTQYFGSLCYSKNPVRADSELSVLTSGKSFASEGYTGTELTIDPVNKLYFFMGGNRVHNRVVYNEDDFQEFQNGLKLVTLPNGKILPDATKFAWEKGDIVDASLELSIQYKMLEDFYKYMNQKVEYQEKIKTL